ncbi:MAG: tandem-95 repeat protein [bacterium]|nr:tandem-95 repeat protein [bacterium]
MRQLLFLTILMLTLAVTASAQTAPPVLDPIGPQSVDEGVLLTIGVTSSDLDATIPTLTTSALPTNATFVDNGDGTATFSFTPDFTQAGTFNVTFYANDIVTSDIDSEEVAITVNNVNQAPILAAIGSQSVAEGASLNFGVTASDADGTNPTLTTSTLPTNASFTDNGNGTGSFSFNPDFTQAGSFNVTFYATDGSIVDSEVVAITVTGTNQAPILAAIGSQSVAEGASLNFGVTATDADGTTPTLTTSTLPTNASFIDNGNGTGSFTFNPDFTQAGSYNVTFYATDGSIIDSEVVAITVTGTNQAPILAAIGSQSVAEGTSLNFGVSATDADGTNPTLTTSTLPTNASFTDNGNGTGSFTFNPDFTQAGSYNVTFYATDGSIIDSEVVAITVTGTNQAPILAAIGAQSVAEGSSLNFGVTATDADGTNPTLTTSTLPTNASFIDNGNGTGSFTFNPDFTQAGSFNVTFYATDGSIIDSEVVAITVTNTNQAPILATIGAQSVAEGASLNFGVSATDADGTSPTLTTSTLPTNALFTDNGNGTGSFTFNPDFTQSGSYNVTFYATDGSIIDSEVVAITVTNTNQAPILATIGAQSVAEGASLNFGVSATDADGTNPTLTTSTLPTNASFTDNGNGTGSFSFNPDFTQAGSFNVTFYATDGSIIDSEVVAITVTNTNQAPILATIGSQSVAEGASLNFGVSATDADGTNPTLTTSTLPTNASFTDNGNGTGSFTFNPDFTQAGSYNVTFYATDGSIIDSEVVAITVTNTNQAPILAAIGAQSVAEGASLNFGVTATDADGTTPTLTTSTLPTNASFTDNGNGTGSFSFNPDFTQAGSYNVTFYATDGSIIDSEVVAITVTGTNQAPILAAIGPRSVAEGASLNFGVTATDADGTNPTLTTSTLPTNASFTDNGNGTGGFTFNPTFTQAGSYNVTFYATDGSIIDSEIVAITVTNTNQAPILAAIGPRSVAEGSSLNFGVTATDADGTNPTLTTSTLPTNASFTDNGNGTGSFSFNPTFAQAGSYNVTFYATDGSIIDSEIVAITVGNTNLLPVLASIGPRSVAEGGALSFGVTATDADGSTPALTTSALPANASFIDNGNGSGSFSFNPSFSQAGIYNITFRASDGQDVDSEIVVITVSGVNQAPVLAAIGPRSVTEGIALNIPVSGSDADGFIPVLTTSALPAGAIFTDNGNGSGSFAWTPTFNRAGSYSVTFYATDDSSAVDSEVVAITVNESGNHAPVLATIGGQSATEGINLSFGVSTVDPDSTLPVLTTSTLPLGASFTDNGNGTGSFSWTPSFTQAGAYNVTFYSSDGTAIDSERVAINVFESGNQAPVLAAIGPRSTTEGINLNFGISATDPDGTTPVLSTSTLPSGANFTNNGNGTGTFNWTPGFTQAGSYNITFRATDGVATDSEIVVITINEAGNQAPVLAAVGNRSVTEGALLSFNISATDPDGTTPSFTALTLPSGANFVDNGNGTGSFSWTPGFTAAGPYTVTFITSDGALADSEVVTITVNDAGNQAPVLAAIGARSTSEGVNLTFGATATDPDGTTPTLSSGTLPTGATFIDNGNGTGTFNWTPSFTQSGGYQVVIRATDGSLSDSEIVTINVLEAGNRAPVFATVGPQSVTEGLLLTIPVNSSDPDGTTPVLTSSTLPLGAGFVDNGDGSGSLTWTPTFLQSGVYNVSFFATDGILRDTELVVITVIDAGNQLPVLSSIGPRSITEGIQLTVAVSATDAEGQFPDMSTGALPVGASFVDNNNGTGTLSWTPLYNQAGVYSVTFRATDDSLAVDSEVVAITVNDAGNQLPILAAIGGRSIPENSLLTFGVSAADPDSTIPALTTSTLPLGASFTDNGNGTGSFSWTPNFVQSGSYPVRFYASDGIAIDSELVTITVTEAGNQAPVLAAIGPRSVTEGLNLSFTISATDPDGTTPSFTTSTLPLNASFTDNGNGTGSFSFDPNFVQAGVYNVTFRTSDGGLVDSEVVVITVNDAGNQAPVLAAIGARSVSESQLLTVNISASDPDATFPTLSTSALPLGASFVNNGNGTGTLTWTPTYLQSAIYAVTFYASDGSIVDSELVTITVRNANAAPVLAAIGPRAVAEGASLSFGVSSSDIDGTNAALTTSSLPLGASFTDNANGTGQFNWSPTQAQAGVYNITFYATDDSSAVDSEIVQITVGNVNQPPVLAAIGAQSVAENVLLSFGVTATDGDGVFPVLSTSALPLGSTFDDNGDGTGSFSWTPSFTQSGLYLVTFYADDGEDIDSETVAITVTEVNLAPVLTAIGPRSIAENSLLSFTITASDPDGTSPQLTSSSLPSGASFADNGNGTGDFDWTPDFTQAGVYEVTFYASDGQYVDSERVTLTVNNSNRAPQANAGTDQIDVPVNSTVLLDGTSSFDPDLEIITYSWTQVSGTAVTLTGALTATPSFVPPLPGSYTFQLIVSDNNLFSTPDTVVVSAINAAPPQAITDLSIAIITDNIQLNWSAITLDTAGLPTQVGGYIIYRDTMAHFAPTSADSIGAVTPGTLTFTDNNIFGANVVGDTLNQYFYVVVPYDIYGNRSAVSNRVGEYDYAILTTATTDFNLICVPFTNTGITNAVQLIAAIGVSNVNTVNNYNPTSQSFESRFAAGFGVNFSVVPGGIYQVNAANATTFSVAGRVPAPSAISYQLITTASTDYSFLSIPFDHESQFATAQDVLNNVPGGFNTLNRFVAASQSYQSRFAAGFGTNFTVKAGKPYQANNAASATFPQ